VTQGGSGMPLEGVSVRLEGTNLGALTQANGRFVIANVPAGTHTLKAEMIGHAPLTRSVTVNAGQATTLALTLELSAISLQEIVVTGTAGATTKAKLPFTVERISADQLPVPQVSAASALQGKAAGVTVVSGSGRPGSAPAILLRGPTSINSAGRSQEPLYIVDGVVLSSSMADLDAMDIENIEIVKGAAAASLYGSRAGNGVVQITTKRGRRADQGQIRYTVRSEYGQSDLPGTFDRALHHNFKMNADGTKFIDQTGKECDFLQCASLALAGQRAAPGKAADNWNTYMTGTWPGETHDHVKEFFTNGAFMQNYVAAAGRVGGANFHASFSQVRDQGVMPGQDGMRRNNYRINLDQNIQENVQLSASAFYSRSRQNAFGESQGNPVFRLTRMPAGVNLAACMDDITKSCMDNPDKLILRPHPGSDNTNPLYELLKEKTQNDRGRFLGSTNVRVSPTSWLDVDANVSYDRLDRRDSDYRPKGYRTIKPDADQNGGFLERYHLLTESLNAGLTASFRKRVGELSTRTQFRYLYEREDQETTDAYGYRFTAQDVPILGGLQKDRTTMTSSQQRVLSEGFFAITNLDFRDRYIVDALIRQDGSSLFGADERYHWYYRIAGAYRLSEEPWFKLPGINEFKLRYALGTAGGRPRFTAQYETYSVSSTAITPVNLGNKALKPEDTREQAMGIDLTALDRLSFTAEYSNAITRDQLLPASLQAFKGFGTQWQNAGTMQSKSWEASLEARLVDRPGFSWSTRVLFDRTRSVITELNVPNQTYGVDGQAMGDVFYARKGEVFGTFYGAKYAKSCADLPTGTNCDGFQVNDDGLLVWVGKDNTLKSGLWGTDGPLVNGVAVKWGTPVVGQCTDRSTGERTAYCPLGKTMPDYHLGFSSTATWHGLTIYGLLDSTQGFNVYNQPLQWALQENYAGIMDQTGKPEADQKPLGYYIALYNILGPNSRFVEDASYVKLREVSLNYRLNTKQLSVVPGLGRFNSIGLSLIGRNLLTWTKYSGYDPEVGRGGGQTGSAAIARVDGFNYPNFRTWTAAIELNF
jgi:TonB-linked SusC/RagA family outer membrane protein